MKTITRAGLAALLIIAVTVLAAGCGSSSSSDTKTQGNATDRAFVKNMIPHHRSAVQMASIAKGEATGTFAKTLASNITRTQTAEIAQMQNADKKLADAGIKVGDLGMSASMMGMHDDAAMLRGARPFDQKFITMMLPHHLGAIAMARVELAKGSNPELKKLATNIIRAQQSEVAQMRAHKTT